MVRTALVALLVLAACQRPTGSSAQPASPPAAPVVLRLAYGSEKKTWLEEQATRFVVSGARTRAGRPIRVDLRAMGSGEAVQDILAGTLQPHVFSPASSAYIVLLNDRWLSLAGHLKPLCPAGEPVVLSPVVIAMWRPMAEALGWPAKSLGWSDLLRINTDPRGWASHGRPEWGRFKLGHTHPEFSNSGLLAVLAEAYAGARKTRGLTGDDLSASATRKFIASIESSIVHYGKSTGFFAEKMVARGPSYLSAAVLYENLVVESHSRPSPSGLPLVSIYPVEGTFWSDHPYAVLDAEWVSAEEREAAEAFLAFLKARPAQERALALGFRPADPAVAIAVPIDAAHGADPRQPQTLLELPGAPVLRKLLETWQASKRATDVELVFDKSGSMNGRPLAEAKEGAKSFLSALGPRDRATLLFFDHQLYPAVGPATIASGREEMLARIDGLIAEGGTALYDATAAAYDAALERARKDPSRIHALVVMTDGKDENSRLPLDDLRARLSGEAAPVKVFTIAYGSQADSRILEQIAEAAQGSSFKGTSSNIVQVYQDIASFF